MSGIRVIHDIDDLASDMAAIPPKAAGGFARVVRSNAEQGNRLARGFAKQSAGAHGKHYPNAMSTERRGPFEWEYGPDAGKPQGGMSFERGSRNQPPHLDLARSADIVGPQLANDASDVIDGLFW